MMKKIRKLIALILALSTLTLMSSALSLADFAGADSVRSMAYAAVGSQVTPDYLNVFDPDNQFNADGQTQYGKYSTLTLATFGEEGEITELKGVLDRDGDLNLKKWQLTETEIDSDSDTMATSDGLLYVGNNTVFFIYLYYTDLQSYNVISFTGISKMPGLTVAGGSEPYGVVNCYGVPADPGGDSVDAKVVVFELDIGPNGDGLPILSVGSNWIYVYSVDEATRGYCQTVRGVNAKGELVTAYNDSWYSQVDADTGVGLWYAYYNSPDADCTTHENHVVLCPYASVDTEYGYKGVFRYTSDLGAWLIDALNENHNDMRYVTMSGGRERLVDFSSAKFYMYCDSVGQYYNNDEIFRADYAKLTAEGSPFNKTGSSDDYRWILIYRGRSTGTLTALAVIVKNENPLTQSEYNRLAGEYGFQG